jgi:hypothetical protein
METMDYSTKTTSRGIASIDQSKAFDNVSHSYMEKVYRFSGFGDHIKRWLTSIGAGHKACIILGSDVTSA